MSEGPRGSRTGRWLLALVVVLAFGLRLAAVLEYEARHPNAENLSIDEASYDRWARSIASGDWIGKEVFFQEPLYPYALGAVYAVFGPHPLAARVLQCALWAATAVLAGLLARRVFGRTAGWITAFLLALYGPGLLFPALLLKENLFLPLLALLALVLLRTRDDRGTARLWISAGVLAGLGCLLRGNMVALLPVLALWPIARGRRRGAGLLLAGAAAVLLPVAARNLAVGGVPLPTTSGAGTNLYGGNNLENPYGRATEPGFVRGIPEHEAGDWRREAERRLGRPLGPAAVGAYWAGETWRSFREHPLAHLEILWRKLRLSLGRYEVPDDHCLDWDARYVALARFPFPGFGLVGALGIAGILLVALRSRGADAFAPEDPGAALELALLLLAYLGTIVLTVTSDRARLPLVPLLAPFAAWTVVWAARAAARRSQAALVPLALALFAGVLAVFVRTLPDAEVAEDLDERDFNLAVLLLRDGGHGAEVRPIAERLVRAHPDSARSRILLAEVGFRDATELARSPRPAERQAGLERLGVELARVAPLAEEPSLNARERFRAASLCAWIELEQGQVEAAAAAFREARAFDPDAPDLREGLARALLARADAGPAAESRAGIEEALGLLRGSSAPNEGLVAQAEFFLGRALLAEGKDPELGKRSVQAALTHLQTLAGSPAAPADVRRRARLLAGSIQLYRGNWKPAENHFRAALVLGDDAEARTGLLQALLGGLEAAPAGGDRAARLAESAQLLERLEAAGSGSPALLEMRARMGRLR
jgi:4-amino-4-deoxy-L-arabinose transferase-like glycosyltransferase